ncbi:hypothetical protein EXIGLDRAFT_58976 [Exidia glandulosa HHB12029]|uniref:Uncharacterized protein n=1 Tax=Exidia glandulosa HHB12029 TaxID=1314781 RepID=A0A165I538_EXIGL|nr:hypothetical protein EXIGLDRAFT_58976 [Exidia glandulosa HHB12029]
MRARMSAKASRKTYQQRMATPSSSARGRDCLRRRETPLGSTDRPVTINTAFTEVETSDGPPNVVVFNRTVAGS